MGSSYIRRNTSVRKSFIQFEFRFIVRKYLRASMSITPLTKVLAPDDVWPNTFPI